MTHPRRLRGSYWGREKVKTGEKKFRRRKVKNERKSPWRQGLNRPVLNGRSSSGFCLVPENFCFFLANHRAATLGVVTCLLTRNVHTSQLLAIFVWVVRRGEKKNKTKENSRRKLFSSPFSSLAALWLGRTKQKFSGTNQKPELLRRFETGPLRPCPLGLFLSFLTFLRPNFFAPVVTFSRSD